MKEMHRFEKVMEGHRKFYELTVSISSTKCSVVATYGKIGSRGIVDVKYKGLSGNKAWEVYRFHAHRRYLHGYEKVR